MNRLILGLLLVCFFVTSNAQNELKGVVKDNKSGLPLAAVSIYLPDFKKNAFNEFVKRNEHDNIKKKYCNDNTITLIIVSYLNTPKQIEQIITNTINNCKNITDTQLLMIG